MTNHWTKIFTSSNVVEASLVVTMLQENGIEAVELNKLDSSYLSFGLIEVYCRPEKTVAALHLINDSKNIQHHEE